MGVGDYVWVCGLEGGGGAKRDGAAFERGAVDARRDVLGLEGAVAD